MSACPPRRRESGRCRISEKGHERTCANVSTCPAKARETTETASAPALSETSALKKADVVERFFGGAQREVRRKNVRHAVPDVHVAGALCSFRKARETECV